MDKRIENALLNVRKTTRLLDVHPNTLRNWTNQGRLPCYTVNARGDRRFRREDIEEFLARHRRLETQPDKYVVDRGLEKEGEHERAADTLSARPQVDLYAVQSSKT